MQIDAYLQFNGDCEAAFKFYEKVLGAKIEMIVRHRDAPMRETVPSERQDQIIHARLAVEGKVIMGMDSPPELYRTPAGFHVSLAVDSRKEAERIFDAFAEGGNVGMPLQKTFWAESFGMVVDRFGIPWMVGTVA